MIDLEILARIRGSLAQSGDGGTAQLPIDVSKAISLANGTAADEANGIYIDEFTIAASGSASYDLSGALTDRLGNALVFTAIKAILLIADAANTNNIIMGNGANPFVGPFGAGAHTALAEPGGVILFATRSAAGWAVTNATADTLKLANSGGSTSVSGTLVVIGEA